MNQPQTVIRRNPKNTVEQLKAEASSNTVFNDVCMVFAARERARAQINLGSFRLSMAREGFIYSRDQLANVLVFLANLGIGKLEKNPNGSVKCLSGIQITLQSIGRAAISGDKQVNLEKFAPAAAYTKLSTSIVPVQAPAGASVSKTPVKHAAALLMVINGQQFTFDIPNGLTDTQLGEMLAEFYGSKLNH